VTLAVVAADSRPSLFCDQ